MSEIFGTGGAAVVASGDYECSECGYRVHLMSGDVFPPDHHAEKPWTLYVGD